MKRLTASLLFSKVVLFTLIAGLLATGCGPAECGNGTCEVGEVPGSCPEDCPLGTCPGGDYPGACTSDEECQDRDGPLAFCNPQSCNCMTCPESSDNCHNDDDCVTLLGAGANCLLHNCTCEAATPVCGNGTCDFNEVPGSCPEDCPLGTCPGGDYPGACTSDEECQDREGPLAFCNPGVCNCMTCPESSDNCHNDDDCVTLLGAGANCLLHNCMCEAATPVCGDGKVDAGEECDGGVAPGTCEEVCDPDLYPGPVPCGPDPDCDRGGCEPGFYCGTSCTCESAPTNVCGDHYTSHEEGEQCEPYGCTMFPDIETCPADPGPGITCTEVDGGTQRCTPNEFCSKTAGEVCDPDTCQCIPGPPAPVSLCGNGRCEGSLGETCSSCEADCGPCPLPGADGSLCGDGICQEGESGAWCGDCPAGEEPEDKSEEPEKPDKPQQPPSQGPVCGNGKVEKGEACDPPGIVCYDAKGFAGSCQPDCTCQGPY